MNSQPRRPQEVLEACEAVKCLVGQFAASSVRWRLLHIRSVLSTGTRPEFGKRGTFASYFAVRFCETQELQCRLGRRLRVALRLGAGSGLCAALRRFRMIPFAAEGAISDPVQSVQEALK